MQPGAPQKPSVELGIIDYPSDSVIANMTGGRSFQSINSVESATYKNVATAILTGGKRVPLASYDRAICFRPAWWGIEQGYVHALERYIVNHCSGN